LIIPRKRRALNHHALYTTALAVALPKSFSIKVAVAIENANRRIKITISRLEKSKPVSRLMNISI
jgi:phosphoribosyl-dephospho-CoA transferase